jgi:hypothetical protein
MIIVGACYEVHIDPIMAAAALMALLLSFCLRFIACCVSICPFWRAYLLILIWGGKQGCLLHGLLRFVGLRIEVDLLARL